MKYWSRHVLLFAVFIVTILFGVSVGAPITAHAATFTSGANYTLEQPLLGVTKVQSASEYIIIVYQFGIGLVGIIAVVLIMFGGYRWVTSAGNEQTISSAKETIVAAVSGLIIALLAYSILVFINPNLTKLTFNPQQLDVTNPGGDASKYPPCSDPKFKGLTCKTTDSPSRDVLCEDPVTACGAVLFNDTVGYCRGVTCTDVDTACVQGLDSQYTCKKSVCADQLRDCGASYGVGTKDHVNCTCKYYQDATSAFGYQSTALLIPTYADQAGYDLYKEFCSESTPQDDWTARAVLSPTFKGTPTDAANIIWNCEFKCPTTTIFVPALGEERPYCGKNQ